LPLGFTPPQVLVVAEREWRSHLADVGADLDSRSCAMADRASDALYGVLNRPVREQGLGEPMERLLT
jgi:hypothetical protein